MWRFADSLLKIVPQVLCLQEQLKKAVQDGDMETSHGICRIAVALGETHCRLDIMTHIRHYSLINNSLLWHRVIPAQRAGEFIIRLPRGLKYLTELFSSFLFHSVSIPQDSSGASGSLAVLSGSGEHDSVLYWDTGTLPCGWDVQLSHSYFLVHPTGEKNPTSAVLFKLCTFSLIYWFCEDTLSGSLSVLYCLLMSCSLALCFRMILHHWMLRGKRSICRSTDLCTSSWWMFFSRKLVFLQTRTTPHGLQMTKSSSEPTG